MSDVTVPVIGKANQNAIVAAEAAANDSLVKRDGNGDLASNVGSFTRLVLSLGITLKSTAKSGNFTANVAESTFYVVDTSGGSVTVGLPSAASSNGVVFGLIKTSASNNLVLDGASSETINGAGTKTTATQYGIALLWCDGLTWHALLSGTWT